MLTPLSILQNTYGYRQFSPTQERVIQRLLNAENTLVLMPTGGGKSICYQIPAILRDGTGIVISPLIALMQDQVDNLRQFGIRADYLNSSLDLDSQRQVRSRLQNQQLDLLYIAPERLLTDSMLHLLSQCKLALFAIDEAHCVSQWGHDFRPDYLQLDTLYRLFPDIPRVALTATADERTRTEILERLKIPREGMFIDGFDRPNIHYQIRQKNNERKQLLNFIQQNHPNSSGIVYCLSRARSEKTALWLQQQGYDALPYHAGMAAAQRMANQKRFLAGSGVIIVATIAFGMGIDKPDVRFVAHLDLPKSIEAYYQETGRAGRDGEKADAWMVYGIGDIIKLKQMLVNSESSEQRKILEHQRLDAMLALGETSRCRRSVLLNYFGQESAPSCGNCDNCNNPADTWDGTEAAQKALSVVYRTGQRFGINYLIDVLHGRLTERIQNNTHQQLPIFGIGRELDNNQWRSVYRQLIVLGFLNVDSEGFGGIRLDPRCRPLLRAEQGIEFKRDIHRSITKSDKHVPHIEELSAVEAELLELLKQLRRTLAEQQGVPPYVVFHDKTLRDMVYHMPENEQDMMRINGIGKIKLKRYGQAFLRLIKEIRDNDTAPVDGAAERPV